MKINGNCYTSQIARLKKRNAIKLTNVRKICFIDVDNKFKRVTNNEHQNDSHQHCCCRKVPGKTNSDIR